MMRVTTESGNVYWIEKGQWKAQEGRSHDLNMGLTTTCYIGMVIEDPIVGMPLLLAWVHPKRGDQIRVTSTVVAIEEEVEEDARPLQS